MVELIREAWSWIGLDPAEVMSTNMFGNVIVRAADGAFWRICPEEWSCEQVARNADEFAILSSTQNFKTDWEMAGLVELAKQKLGPLSDGYCYCLKVPAVIGGLYEATNLGTVSLNELISFAGDMAEQIKDARDGGKIQIEIIPKDRQG